MFTLNLHSTWPTKNVVNFVQKESIEGEGKYVKGRGSTLSPLSWSFKEENRESIGWKIGEIWENGKKEQLLIWNWTYFFRYCIHYVAIVKDNIKWTPIFLSSHYCFTQKNVYLTGRGIFDFLSSVIDCRVEFNRSKYEKKRNSITYSFLLIVVV